jgi:hypothetical protein
MKVTITVQFEDEGRIQTATRIVPELQSFSGSKSFMQHLNETLLDEEDFDIPGTSQL